MAMKKKTKPASKKSRKPKARTKKQSRPKATRSAKKSAAKGGRPAKKPRAKVSRRGPREAGVALPADSATYPESGDTEGLSDTADASFESVKELEEEGQSFEADAVEAVENAPDPDNGEIRTREVPEDDVPEEYRLPDRD
jgi:hypothetical protein